MLVGAGEIKTGAREDTHAASIMSGTIVMMRHVFSGEVSAVIPR